MQKRSNIFFLIFCFLFVSSLIISIVRVGSPWQEQKRQRDTTRVNHLFMISSEINNQYQQTNSLPTNVSDLIGNYKDPKTGALYDYVRSSETQYQLCAVFETSNRKPTNSNSTTLNKVEYRIVNPNYTDNSTHPAGRHCFTYGVTPKPTTNFPAFNGVWNFDQALNPQNYTSIPGKINQAASFNGNQLYSLGELASSTNGSIALWIKPSNTNQTAAYDGYGTFFGRQVNSVASNLIFSFDAAKNGRAVFWLSHQPTERPYVKSTSIIPVNEWTHLAVTWSNRNVKLYVNGVIENEIFNALPDTGPNTNRTGSNSLGITYQEDRLVNPNYQRISPPPASGDVTVGGVKDGWSGYFNGAIDELNVRNYAMSNQEIIKLSNPAQPTKSPTIQPNTIDLNDQNLYKYNQ